MPARLILIRLALAGTLFLSVGNTYSKEGPARRKTGTISFITSQNIYVRFGNTEGIAAGDTVFSQGPARGIPVMVVNYLLTESCAGAIIGKPDVRIGDLVHAYPRVRAADLQVSQAGKVSPDSVVESQSPPASQAESGSDLQPGPMSRFFGGFTANSYSNFSNFTTGANTQRWSYSLSLNGQNVLGSRVSFSSYMNYSYLGSDWKGVTANPFANVRVYDLAAKYDAGGLQLWAGRHISREISGIGPVDGLEAQKDLGAFSFGVIAGSRPDFYNFGYNSKLLEYGGYITRSDTLPNATMQNTVGLFQQYNGTKTDRRFIYFQHISNPLNNLTLFLTGQIDIFKLVNGAGHGDFSLTDLYFSTFYSPIRLLSLSLSYSALRNTIYYQTFGSAVDSLLQAQNQLRHNIRLGLFLRPFGNTFVNLGAGYSFQQGDASPTRDASISFTQSSIPLLRLSATLSYNRTLSGFLDGSIYNLTLTKYLSFNSSSVSAGYSKLSYDFSGGGMVQNQIDVNISTRLLGRAYFNIYYQGVFSATATYGSFMGGISYRF